MPYKKGLVARWAPTAKWWAATTTAAATIVTLLWTGDGINTDEEKTLVIGLVVSRILAFAVPKDKGQT
jgi:hypothetical protein